MGFLAGRDTSVYGDSLISHLFGFSTFWIFKSSRTGGFISACDRAYSFGLTPVYTERPCIQRGLTYGEMVELLYRALRILRHYFTNNSQQSTQRLYFLYCFPVFFFHF